YYNITVSNNHYAMIANQLVQTNSSVQALFASAPAGQTILKWTGTVFAPNNNDVSFGWDDPTMTLVPGEGFFLKNNASSNITYTFVGEVKQGTNSQAFTAGQYKMISLFTPQAGLLQTDFGYPPNGGDLVLLWSGVTYAPANFDSDFGWD